MAHLEAEKDHLHTVLKEKNRESSELSNRLQETGQILQMRSKQLDELATEIQEARKAKERSEMTQGTGKIFIMKTVILFRYILFRDKKHFSIYEKKPVFTLHNQGVFLPYRT